MLMQRNSTLLAKILMMKPPLTSNAPAMEVTLVPSLAQATEAMGAGEDAQRYIESFYNLLLPMCKYAEEM